VRTHDPTAQKIAKIRRKHLIKNAERQAPFRHSSPEAFDYANVVKDPRDSPNFSQGSPAGGDIALGQDYIVWWWWCLILREVLEPYRLKLPPQEYYHHLNRLQPEFKKLTAGLDKTSEELRKEITTKVTALVGSAFKK